MADEETKLCPYCGEEILAVAKKCKHCGEFLKEENEPEYLSETKQCPFCGEEIQYSAIKCKHCGEFLSENNNSSKDKISKADVNEKWKERFRAVDFFVLDGRWWKYNPNFWKSSMGERWKMTMKLYGDFGSFIASLLFGGFYYLFKGMWLKFIVYSIPTILSGGILWILYPCLAPYDYYRYKVLGEQW